MNSRLIALLTRVETNKWGGGIESRLSKRSHNLSTKSSNFSKPCEAVFQRPTPVFFCKKTSVPTVTMTTMSSTVVSLTLSESEKFSAPHSWSRLFSTLIWLWRRRLQRPLPSHSSSLSTLIRSESVGPTNVFLVGPRPYLINQSKLKKEDSDP